MDRLKNKVIIVTGGNGLIGKEIIKSIESEGGLCMNFDINHENDIKKNLVKCDITNESSVIDSIKFVHTYFGRIDGLVNNA